MQSRIEIWIGGAASQSLQMYEGQQEVVLTVESFLKATFKQVWATDREQQHGRHDSTHMIVLIEAQQKDL